MIVKPPIPKWINEENFMITTEIFRDKIEIIPFFGTLLGIVRDNMIIEGDDDIDFIVDKRERNNVISILKESQFRVEVDAKLNSTPHFFQAARYDQGIHSMIDFYFVDIDKDNNNIINKWTVDEGKNPENDLHIPYNIVFPLKRKKFLKSEILIPNNADACCALCYGKKWREPLKKGLDYDLKIINNKINVFPIPNKDKIKKRDNLIDSLNERMIADRQNYDNQIKFRDKMISDIKDLLDKEKKNAKDQISYRDELVLQLNNLLESEKMNAASQIEYRDRYIDDIERALEDEKANAYRQISYRDELVRDVEALLAAEKNNAQAQIAYRDALVRDVEALLAAERANAVDQIEYRDRLIAELEKKIESGSPSPLTQSGRDD